jgi:hypothetical protein
METGEGDDDPQRRGARRKPPARPCSGKRLRSGEIGATSGRHYTASFRTTGSYRSPCRRAVSTDAGGASAEGDGTAADGDGGTETG